LTSPAVIFEERVRIPVEAHTLDSFRRWAFSEEFPEEGRIDFLGGDVEVDMSPEDLFTHGAVKAAVSRVLGQIVAEGDRGEVFIDSTRLTNPRVGLSAEPDVVVVLWPSLESGSVRLVPAASEGSERFRELEGAADLVVEVVSDRSVGKDNERLPPLYAAAGVTELWLIDARGPEIRFSIRRLEDGRYREVEADNEGWAASPVLQESFRLTRSRSRVGTWRYALEHRPAPLRR
jgi:Uma2 family endonuclease